MPRFDDSHINVIRRVLLPRIPECLFTAEDIERITSETGLDVAQILQWGKNFRLRYPPADREKVLSNPVDDKVQ